MVTLTSSKTIYIHFLLTDFIRVRDGDVHDAISIRNNLFAFYADSFGPELRFVAGEQECASEATERLLQHITKVDGNYVYRNEVKCSNPKCKNKDISGFNQPPGLIDALVPKGTVEEMINSKTEVLDPDYVHVCQVTEEEIRNELARLDNSEHSEISRGVPYCPTASKENLYESLIAKYKALDENGIKLQRIGTAIPTIQVAKIEEAGDYLVFTAVRDPQVKKVETYPTEVLTINGQRYVIRATVDLEGKSPKEGHYTASVFSNNRWYEVNDYRTIQLWSKKDPKRPWPKTSTIYFYEKMGANEQLPIPVTDADFLPPVVNDPNRKSAAVTARLVDEDLDLENALEEMKDIHRRGIDNLNVERSNVSNLTPDNPALKQGLVMTENLKNEYQRPDPCNICNESWFTNFKVNPKNGMCGRCEGLAKKNLYTFGDRNAMVPGPIPQCLKDLTYVEECAIKLAQPVMNLYCRKGGKTGLVGNTITYEQKIQDLVNELPLAGEDMPFCILQKDGQIPKEFTVRPHLLRESLEYLIEHSPAYKHVKISERNLQRYEDSNGLVEGIPILNYDFDYDNEVEQEDMENINERDMVKEADLGGDVAAPQSMVPLQTCTTNIRDMLDKAIRAKEKKDLKTPKFAYPERATKPLSEFAQFYFSMCFPKMFPDGRGDYNMVRIHFAQCETIFLKSTHYLLAQN